MDKYDSTFQKTLARKPPCRLAWCVRGRKFRRGLGQRVVGNGTLLPRWRLWYRWQGRMHATVLVSTAAPRRDGAPGVLLQKLCCTPPAARGGRLARRGCGLRSRWQQLKPPCRCWKLQTPCPAFRAQWREGRRRFWRNNVRRWAAVVAKERRYLWRHRILGKRPVACQFC